MKQPRPIPRRWLICLVLSVMLIPPTFVVTFFLLHRPAPEPKLDVEVALTVMRYQMDPNNASDIRLLSAVKVTNTGKGQYRNIAVSLNKQFFHYHVGALPEGKDFEVPLEFFVTKGGSIKFQTGNKKVNRVTVYAQVDSNARAVAERYFADDGTPTKVE